MNRVKRAEHQDAQPPLAVRPRSQTKGANDNKLFDDKAWRRTYMRLYMRKRRERERAAKDKASM